MQVAAAERDAAGISRDHQSFPKKAMRVEVKPELLRWAAVRSRIEEDVLAARFANLDRWQRGEEDFARATRTPIGYFFLPEPPVERVRCFTRTSTRIGSETWRLVTLVSSLANSRIRSNNR